MSGEKKKVLVITRAAPEISKKYGQTICTAGITDEGELIRIYPVSFNKIYQKEYDFHKFDWVEVECEKPNHDRRKESYQLIKGSTIKVVDSSLREKVKGRVPWQLRSEIISPLCSSGIQELKDRQEEDNTSLGIIRVGELLDFYQERNLTDQEKESVKCFQMVFDTKRQSSRTNSTDGTDPYLQMSKMPQINPTPHVFKYRFRCGNCKEGHVHNMTCEDWELFEAYRTWDYPTEEVKWEKIKDRFFTKFVNDADLHFILGTHFRWKKWMIIGLYYPPKVTRSLLQFTE